MSDDSAEQSPGTGNQEGQQQPVARQSEMESLQAEVAELRRQVAEADAAKQARGHGWRRSAVVLLVILGSIVAAVANVTV